MNEKNGTRLNKYISDAGICSRREADRVIAEGRVRVNGRLAVTGQRVLPSDQVELDGKILHPVKDRIYLALNKPRGITCTSDVKDPDNIIDFLNYPAKLTYCGRLDKDSEGLMLMTNDGDIINRMMKASQFHEKEYIVRVDRKVTVDFLKKMSAGVYLEALAVTTRPCLIEALSDEFSFRIVLTQGLNRQIRRMCEALGFHVVSLKRVRIMNIMLSNLKSGAYRPLTEEEIAKLYQMTGIGNEDG